MKLLIRLGYPFGALVLAQQRGGEHRIVVQVKKQGCHNTGDIVTSWILKFECKTFFSAFFIRAR